MLGALTINFEKKKKFLYKTNKGQGDFFFFNLNKY